MKRNYGIDLLRLVSMFMVVMLHVLGKCGVLDAAEPMSVNYVTVWGIEIICYCAVNCFAIISGYVNAQKKVRLVPVTMVWLQGVFYSMLFSGISWIIKKEPVTGITLFHAFFPVSSKVYWYLSAYVTLCFFIPMINNGLDAMSDGELKRFTAVIVTVFSVIALPLSYCVDPFALSGGYTMLWLMVCYVVGVYLKRSGFGQNMGTWKPLLAFAGCVCMNWMGRIGGEWIKNLVFEESRLHLLFAKYISPVMLFQAVMLFVAFRNMHISGGGSEDHCQSRACGLRCLSDP